MKESYPLVWPSSQPRTRVPEQQDHRQWKKTLRQYCEGLEKELTRFGVVSLTITANIPLSERGNFVLDGKPRDPGVAIYFSRKVKESWSWQDELGIQNPYPKVEEIEAAYRAKVKLYHPDVKPTGDVEIFRKVTIAREQALAIVGKTETPNHEYVMACDLFREVRWNVESLRKMMQSFRTIEMCGGSSMLEGAFRGFEQLPQTAGASHG